MKTKILLLTVIFLSLFATAQINLNEGLVAYYPFNGNANDESGNGNDGTVYGATLTQDRFGNENSAYFFDGLNDHVNVGPIMNFTYNFTYSSWNYLYDNPPLNPWVTFFMSKSYCNDFGAMYQSDEEYIRIYNDGGCLGNRTIYYTLPKETWFLFTLTFDGSSLKMYVNGGLIDNYSYTSPLNDNDDFLIGCMHGNNNNVTYWWYGKNDDIRFYDRALSDQEIQALYTENQPTFTCGQPFTDPRDGQTYQTVPIGSQCWMKENLNIGEIITIGQSASNNETIEKYCYDDDPLNCEIFGGLYSWDEMMEYTIEEGTQGICPEGWHLPTDDEWNILEGTVDSQYPVGDPEWLNTGRRGFDAGGNLKSKGTNYWYPPNDGATNQSEFSALPGGNYSGGYGNMGAYSYFWTSTNTGTYSANYHRYDYNTKQAYRTVRMKDYGLSVRCIKNDQSIQSTSLQGIILDQQTSQPVESVQIILTQQRNTYETTTNNQGEYSFEDLPTGIYNITIQKQGYQSINQIIELTLPISYTKNYSLIPSSGNSVVINDQLTAYASNPPIENPANVYTLSSNVNINNVLEFDGEVIIDKRPSLAHPEVKGSCGLFASNIGKSDTYWIKQSDLEFKYYAEENRLVPLSAGFLLDGTFNIGGFNITIGEIIIDENEDFVEVKSIAKMPWPINVVVDSLLNMYTDNIPFFVEQMSGSRILSKTNGVQTAVDISDITVNMGIISLEDVHLYFNTNEQIYGGGFQLSIPGGFGNKTASPDSVNLLHKELQDVPVEIRNEDNQVVDSLSMEEFIMRYQERGFKLLSVGAEIEFVQGALNTIIVSIGTQVPLGPTGLFLTEVTGGLEDLATENWKIIANVNIAVGVEVPPFGPVVGFNDFGVVIQPWEYFKGGGEFQVFGQTVSDGYLEYNRPLSSVSAECNLNLASVMTGNTEMNLVGGQINGSGLLTIQTPADLPWILNWAENKRIGSALAEMNNEYFQSEVDLNWISLAQKLQFGKDGFPWFHYYLGSNLNILIKVWKGTKDDKQAIIFQIPENSPQLLIVASDTLNPTPFDFTLQSPSGQIIDQTNAHYYEKNEVGAQTIMSVLQPMEGDWYFLTDYEGDIALATLDVNQQPTTLTNEPQSRKVRSNEVSLNFNDFSDTLHVEVYYDNNRKDFNGSLIDEFTLINNGNLEFTWQNDHIPNGEYFIYCRVDDNYNPPNLQYAPGSIWVENDQNIEVPQGFSAAQANEFVLTSWDNPTTANIVATTVYFKNITTGRIDEISVYDSTSATITDLEAGQEYQLWACFINENGTHSEPSNHVNLIFTSGSRNNPPYFTLDPDSSFVFVVEQQGQYTLTANDADGNNLIFDAPDDTLGVTINGNQLAWTPAEEQKGVYALMLTVTDGTETDTTHQQMVVYSQQQVSVDLAFSSVNLYEDDNMFVKIRNYFCTDYYQETTLRNIRTQEEATVECRRVDDFNYIGKFDLSFINRSEISVANGDTIEVKYLYEDEEYYAYAYYDSLPQPSDQIPPGVIADLSLTKLENNQLKLRWTATGNNGEEGKAYKYDIRYAYEPITTEGIYFTANLIEEYPYPSVSGEQDSLIIDLNTLTGIMEHDTIFFSIKAEDEMQNRGGLSNSPGEACLIGPQNVQAELVDVFKIQLDWTGPEPVKGETGFEYYNLFRKINDGDFFIYESGVEETSFTDNLKYYDDGTYQYAVQAVYETGTTDSVLTAPIQLDRFVDVNVLCSLEDSTHYEDISFVMQGLDTIYQQSFERTTNSTGLILLGDVFKTDYEVEITKDGFDTINETITVSNQQSAFNFMLWNTFRTIQVSLPNGWSGISSPIQPENSDIESMLESIVSDLIILQNSSGLYWPAQNINTLGNWNTHQGYQIKVTDDIELTISGARENDKTLQLAAGWNLIPVLSECDVDVVTLFDGVDVVIVKEVAGWNVYWPGFGINTLGMIQPGKAYFVLMNEETEITFPECDGSKSSTLNGAGTGSGGENLTASPDPSAFELQPTAFTHTIAIPDHVLSDFEIQENELICAVDSEGRCFGMGSWQEENTSITVFGDDPLTPEKDGFAEGEEMYFELLEPESNQKMALNVEYNQALPQHNGKFQTNGLSAIAALKAQANRIQIPGLSGIEIFPNPAKELLNIRVDAAHGQKFEIIDMKGQLLLEGEIAGRVNEVGLAGLQAGVYMVKVHADNAIAIKRFVKH